MVNAALAPWRLCACAVALAQGQRLSVIFLNRKVAMTRRNAKKEMKKAI